MAVFVVLAQDYSNTDTLDAAIRANYPRQMKYGKAAWFVAAEGKTPQTLAQSLGVNPTLPSLSGVAVLQLAGPYWGRANADVWAWLKASFEKTDG